MKNKLLIVKKGYPQKNLFGLGSELKGAFGGGGGGAWGALGTAANASADVIGNLANKGASNAVGKTFNSISDAIPAVGPYSLLAKGILKTAGIVANGFTNSVNEQQVRQKGAEINNFANQTSNATDYNQLQEDYNALQDNNIDLGKIDDWGGKGFLSSGSRRRNAYENAKTALETATKMRNMGLAQRGQNINLNNTMLQLQNLAAFGGPLGDSFGGSLGILQQDKFIDAINNRSNALAKTDTINPSSSYTSLTANRFSDGGGIHIKPSHRGLFTEKANRAGMGVQAYASHVLANKEDYPSSTVKQANFAKNAAGWKHDGGGSLELGFMDSFSQDPIAAAMQYTQGLDAMEAAQEAQAEQAAQEAAYNDMQKRLARAETQNQGLQALLDSQALSLKTLEDRQAAAQEWGNDWKSRMVENAETYKGNANDTAVMARMRKSLQERGVTKRAHQDAIIANMMVESKGDPNAKNANSSARGLMQWLSDRHPSKWDWDSQVDHIVNTYNKYGENNWLDKKAHKKFMDTDDSLTAARLFRQYWERPEPETYKATDKYINQMYGLDKKAFGGELGTNGTDFTNGLLEINSGGSHEENPFEGVQMGLDPNGVPNLVEEGETVYNDYVFSKRMAVPEFMKKELGLASGKKDITFADASKKIAEESKERPNDPISQAGLDAGLAKLAQVQETERSRMQAEEANAEMESQMACGGRLHALGDWLLNDYNWLAVDPAYQQSNTPGFIPYDRAKDAKWIAEQENSQNFRDWTNYVLNNWDTEPVQGYLKELENKAGGNHLFGDNISKEAAQAYFKRARGVGDDGNHAWGYYHLTPSRAGASGISDNAGVADPTKINTGYTTINPEAAKDKPQDWQIAGALNKKADAQLKGITDDLIKGNNEEYDPYPTWMRYAPVVGSGIMTLTDALGLTNKPDYTYADKIEAAAERAGYAPNINYTPIGEYLKYNPLDVNFYANQLRSTSAGNRRAVLNSNASAGARNAMLLAQNYNDQNALGNLYRQAEEYNTAQRAQTADFNRRTDMVNSQMGLEAAMANARYRQAAAHASLSGLAQAAAIRDAIDQRVGAARSANITNLLQGLSNIGRENFAMNQINSDRSRRYKGRLNGTSYYSAFGGEIEKFQKNKRNRRK